jgi:hypothetical protein
MQKPSPLITRIKADLRGFSGSCASLRAANDAERAKKKREAANEREERE